MAVKKFTTVEDFLATVDRRVARKKSARAKSVRLARQTFRRMAAAVSRFDVSLAAAVMPASHYANLCGLRVNPHWAKFRELEVTSGN